MTSSSTSREPDGSGTPARPTSDAPEQRPAARSAVPVTLLLFAAAREAAGCSRCELRAGTVGEVLDQARVRFGSDFAAILDGSRVWVNGEPVSGSEPLRLGDEVAVLPPVSGG